MKNTLPRLLLAACLLLASAARLFAGYTITSSVETLVGSYRYTWSVYNQDQSWGLDGFALPIPYGTNITSYTMPASYSPGGSWILMGTDAAWLGPDGNPIVVDPPTRCYWFIYWGSGPASVYPPGTTVVFSMTTDSSAVPGIVSAGAVTYLGGPYRTLYYSTDGPTTPVPEPSSILTLLSGLGGIGVIMWRTRG